MPATLVTHATQVTKTWYVKKVVVSCHICKSTHAGRYHQISAAFLFAFFLFKPFGDCLHYIRKNIRLSNSSDVLKLKQRRRIFRRYLYKDTRMQRSISAILFSYQFFRAKNDNVYPCKHKFDGMKGFSGS